MHNYRTTTVEAGWETDRINSSMLRTVSYSWNMEKTCKWATSLIGNGARFD